MNDWNKESLLKDVKNINWQAQKKGADINKIAKKYQYISTKFPGLFRMATSQDFNYEYLKIIVENFDDVRQGKQTARASEEKVGKFFANIYLSNTVEKIEKEKE